MTPRFPIGLKFSRKRFPKAKELTEYTIEDIILISSVKTGKVFRIEYSVSHQFMGQTITENVCDTTIARSLTNEQLEQYL